MYPNYYFESDFYLDREESFYSLVIELSEKECVIAISNTTSQLVFFEVFKKPPEFSYYDFLVVVLSEHQAIVSQNYHQVTLAVQTEYFALVPDELNVGGSEILSLLGGDDDRKVLADDVEFLNATMLYSIPQNLFDLISEQFTSFDVELSTSTGLSIANSLRAFSCFLFISEDEFDIITKKGEQIYSVSRHQFDQIDDIVYYVLLALKDADIDPHQARLAISGKCDRDSDLIFKLEDFVLAATVDYFDGGIEISSDFGKPKQYYQYALNLLDANR